MSVAGGAAGRHEADGAGGSGAAQLRPAPAAGVRRQRSPAPLVVDFHGIGGTGTSELASSPYPSLLDPAGRGHGVSRRPQGAGRNGLERRPLLRRERRRRRVRPRAGGARSARRGLRRSRSRLRRRRADGRRDGLLSRLPAPPTCSRPPPPRRSTCWPRTWAPASRQRAISVISFRGTADPRVPYAAALRRWCRGCRSPSWARMGSFQAWAQIDRLRRGGFFRGRQRVRSLLRLSGRRRGDLSARSKAAPMIPGIRRSPGPCSTRHTL